MTYQTLTSHPQTQVFSPQDPQTSPSQSLSTSTTSHSIVAVEHSLASESDYCYQQGSMDSSPGQAQLQTTYYHTQRHETKLFQQHRPIENHHIQAHQLQQFVQQGNNLEQKDDLVQEEGEFDPTAPITMFNSKTELEAEWDQIQKEIVPFLQDFATEALSSTFDVILQLHYIFHQLETCAQRELRQGVQMIEEEEQKQEAARKVITDFSNEMKRAAEVLKRFGNKRNTPKLNSNPSIE
ncbi:uncharacterized protein L203_104237 [Cryptococcus depauperatus CBS 7841]|uniref:Uncharacterized protein n=1 Tax=Cryptococcus depauperatus CBS 7841 TaxID=1295531 RepID=A0AAJ8JV91_9TREE